MTAIQADEGEVAATLRAFEGQVAVAAVNGPDSVVVSGDRAAVDAVQALWRERGRRTRALNVSHAFHSPHMDGILAEFRDVASALRFHEPRIPLVSTVTGALATTAELTSPDYWTSQIRESVRFLDAVRTLRERGATVFVEVGPDAVLTAMAVEAARAPQGSSDPDSDGSDGSGTHHPTEAQVVAPATAVALLRAGRPEAQTLAAALGTAYVNGAALDAASFFPASTAGSSCRRTPSSASTTGSCPSGAPTPARWASTRPGTRS